MIQLTRKERLLLEDRKAHEELCILKYNSYAQQAGDARLKQLFSDYAGREQQHLDTINQILAGRKPAMGTGQQSQTAPPSSPPAISRPLAAEARRRNLPGYAFHRKIYLRHLQYGHLLDDQHRCAAGFEPYPERGTAARGGDL